MANHESAKKRMRQSIRRRDRNRAARSECRTSVKAVREAIEAGDLESAEKLLRTVDQTLQSAATKGVYHQKTVSRHIGRLAQMLQKRKTQGAPATA